MTLFATNIISNVARIVFFTRRAPLPIYNVGKGSDGANDFQSSKRPSPALINLLDAQYLPLQHQSDRSRGIYSCVVYKTYVGIRVEAPVGAPRFAEGRRRKAIRVVLRSRRIVRHIEYLGREAGGT